MKLGLFGLPQSGKATLFSLLTGSVPQSTGIAHIRDDRFDKLISMYNPKSEASARIDIELLPKIEQDVIQSGSLFRDISTMDALCLIVRAFSDESVYHVSGSVDYLRDLNSILGELILHDLIFIEKRMERIIVARKKKADKALDVEEELLTRCKDHLEQDLHLKTMEFTPEEEKLISGYPLVTRKEILVVLNVSEDDASNSALPLKVEKQFASQKINVMSVSAALEKEISMLESDEEKKEFMEDAGIEVSALVALSRLSMKALNLISYFTVGTDEVRQWLVQKGATAPEAAGVIHSDIERGFIRAEMMKYNDLMELCSEEAVKKAGKFHVMGKDYIVEDGDILNFRFNV